MKKADFKKMMTITMLVSMVVMMTSCGGKKNATATTQADPIGREVIIPCSDMEFQTDGTHFRGTGMAEGINMSSVRRRASLDANAALAASVNRTIKSVTDRYTQDVTAGNANEFAEKFEDLTRSVVNQSLNNVSTVCSKIYEKDGKYSVYVAVEAARDELLGNISEAISRDARLRLDYDKMKFETIFNEEMEKLSREGR